MRRVRSALYDEALMSILIAEDKVAQRRYLRELMEQNFSAHVPVIEASDGASTVELALAQRPELCVLAIHMPGVSGGRPGRGVRRRLPAACIRVGTWAP